MARHPCPTVSRRGCYAQFNGCAWGSREWTSSDRPGLTENAAKMALQLTFTHILTNWLSLGNSSWLLRLHSSEIYRLYKAVRFVIIYASRKDIKALRYSLSWLKSCWVAAILSLTAKQKKALTIKKNMTRESNPQPGCVSHAPANHIRLFRPKKVYRFDIFLLRTGAWDTHQGGKYGIKNLEIWRPLGGSMQFIPCRYLFYNFKKLT